MRYLRVPPAAWEKHQHYHDDRTIAWVKFYTSLLIAKRNVDYAMLPDAAKALLHHLWLLAGETKNRIPYNREWISREKLNLRSPINLEPLLRAGFLEVTEDSSIAVPELLDVSLDQPLAPLTRGIGSKSLNSSSGFNPEDSFRELWADVLEVRVPHPVHKDAARRAYVARVATSEMAGRIVAALAHYRASERVSRGFVQDAPNWIRDWEQWETYDESPRITAVPDVGAAPVAALQYVEPVPEPNAWSAVVDALESPEWLRDSRLIVATDDALKVGVPTPRHIDEIRERYGRQIRQRVGAVAIDLVVVGSWKARRSA